MAGKNFQRKSVCQNSVSLIGLGPHFEHCGTKSNFGKKIIIKVKNINKPLRTKNDDDVDDDDEDSTDDEPDTLYTEEEIWNDTSSSTDFSLN